MLRLLSLPALREMTFGSGVPMTTAIVNAAVESRSLAGVKIYVTRDMEPSQVAGFAARSSLNVEFSVHTDETLAKRTIREQRAYHEARLHEFNTAPKNAME